MIFYDTDKLSYDQKLQLMRDCKDVCYEWRANALDCSASFSRTHLDCEFEEILEHLHAETFTAVIDRGTWGDFNERDHFEIAFRDWTTAVNYFLFIEVDAEKMPPIIEKYGLEPRGRQTR